jgi:hypothetical protein
MNSSNRRSGYRIRARGPDGPSQAWARRRARQGRGQGLNLPHQVRSPGKSGLTIPAAKHTKEPARKPAAIDLEAELARIAAMDTQRAPPPLARAGGQGGAARVLEGTQRPRARLRHPGRTARGPLPRAEEAFCQSRCRAAAADQSRVRHCSRICRRPSRGLCRRGRLLLAGEDPLEPLGHREGEAATPVPRIIGKHGFPIIGLLPVETERDNQVFPIGSIDEIISKYTRKRAEATL